MIKLTTQLKNSKYWVLKKNSFKKYKIYIGKKIRSMFNCTSPFVPQVYRDGANDGFHEAIGELMGMISATPKHLYKIGLLDELVEDEELDLNFLMSQALITVSTLPFHLVNDLWRWRAFAGQVSLRHQVLFQSLKADITVVQCV